MSLNMKTLTQAFAKASAAFEKTVQTTVQEVTGLPKPLQEYDLLHQIGSAGPGLVWKLYHAKARTGNVAAAQYTSMCVWVLDKKALSEARVKAGLTKVAEDAFLEIVRGDAGRLVRLRHPGVVHVVQGLDESKNAMAMVTEPLFASAANALGNVENIDNVPKELKGMEMGLLEVKHGLLQIAETLDFLHNNARLIHRAISPETVLITSNGAWKLGGFGFAISIDQASDLSYSQAFHYTEYDVEDSVLPLQPSLNYTAPELVRSKTPSVGCSSDVFSFGCLAYHLIAHKRLFDCNNNVKMYMNSLTYLSRETLSAIPSELVSDLQRVLSANEAERPTALDFTSSSFFRDDTRLRALRFLDHMLERDNIQKSEFLKALSEMWKDFDSRILRYKVLPPLCAELRNLVMQPMILPMVLTIAESQDKNDFALSTLPALVPVLSTASGDTLLLLVKHAELIINKASQDHLISHVLPMLVRAYDDNDNRLQEEALKKAVPLAKQLDAQLVNQAVLPRVHSLALRTTVAAVRVNALLCLSDMIQMLDKPAVLEILQTIQRCTSVDRSPPTLMCTLGIANSILKRYGIEFTAEHVLPLVMPLLIAQQLNVQQFAKYMAFVKDILRKIEEKRGVTLTDSGFKELRSSPATNGQLPSQAVKQPTTASTTRRSPSWDEDWIPPTRSSTTVQPSLPISSSKPSTTTSSEPTNLASNNATSTVTSAASGQQQQSSCPAVDVEWPPRPSLEVTGLPSNTIHSNDNKGSSNSSFDDLDPFANWPPRSSGSSNASASLANNGLPTSRGASFPDITTLNGLDSSTRDSSSWAFNSLNTTGAMRQNQGMSSLNISNSSSGTDSLGFLKQTNSNPTLQTGKATDLGSIFSPFKGDQTALKIAPPPMTAVGRGRGRGRGNQGQPAGSSGFRSSQVKPKDEQPPLLNLL